MSQKKMMKKLVESPSKTNLDLLKKCEKCPFFLGCFYLPDSEICKKLLKDN